MSNAFSLEELPFESYFDFDPENFDLELTESEWEEEMRRGLPFPSHATTAYRQSKRPQRSIQKRPWPPRHPVRGYAPPQPPLFVDLRIDGEPASGACPAHGTEFVRWVQSSLNLVLGLRLPVTGVMSTATRSSLRRFQQQHGLTADGIAGPETKRALVEAKKTEREQQGGLTDSAEYEELAEVNENLKADAFVADNDGKKYFDTFPQLGNLIVQQVTILKPSNFENLRDRMLASSQKNFVIDAHGNPNGLSMPLASATRISATKNSLFFLTGIEYIRSLIRTAKESDTFWKRASGADLDRWRRIVEVLHSKIWQQMVARWPKITPQVPSVGAAKSIVRARLNALVDSLFPGNVANKQDRVDRLINKMLRLQAKRIREVQFRACNIGKDASSLYEFRKFFGADHLCAPDVRSGIGSVTPSIDRRAVDRLARNRRTQVFNIPSGRFAILINVLNGDFKAFCAADAQAAANEWVATHIMPNSRFRRGAFPIHFLKMQPPAFPLDSEYATHIKCRSSFWEGVVRGSEKHRQEIEDYDELDEEQKKPENEFENCSNLQKNRLQTASNWAKDAVSRAAAVVGSAYGRPDRMSPRTRQVLIKHFRTTDRDDLLKILLKLRSIKKAFEEGVNFKCETKCDPIRGVIPCGHALSTQWFGGFGDVHICFDSRPNGCDFTNLSAYSQTALIIHEVAHRYVGVHDQAFFNDARQAYFDSSGRGVRLSSKNAMNNADSYAYFSLDL
jgi:hypothetical protein